MTQVLPPNVNFSNVYINGDYIAERPVNAWPGAESTVVLIVREHPTMTPGKWQIGRNLSEPLPTHARIWKNGMWGSWADYGTEQPSA